jgi:hypothetical protein
MMLFSNMKYKLIKLASFSILAIILITSCSSNNKTTVSKTENPTEPKVNVIKLNEKDFAKNRDVFYQKSLDYSNNLYSFNTQVQIPDSELVAKTSKIVEDNSKIYDNTHSLIYSVDKSTFNDVVKVLDLQSYYITRLDNIVYTTNELIKDNKQYYPWEVLGVGYDDIEKIAIAKGDNKYLKFNTVPTETITKENNLFCPALLAESENIFPYPSTSFYSLAYKVNKASVYLDKLMSKTTFSPKETESLNQYINSLDLFSRNIADYEYLVQQNKDVKNVYENIELNLNGIIENSEKLSAVEGFDCIDGLSNKILLQNADIKGSIGNITKQVFSNWYCEFLASEYYLEKNALEMDYLEFIEDGQAEIYVFNDGNNAMAHWIDQMQSIDLFLNDKNFSAVLENNKSNYSQFADTNETKYYKDFYAERKKIKSLLDAYRTANKQEVCNVVFSLYYPAYEEESGLYDFPDLG